MKKYAFQAVNLSFSDAAKELGLTSTEAIDAMTDLAHAGLLAFNLASPGSIRALLPTNEESGQMLAQAAVLVNGKAGRA